MISKTDVGLIPYSVPISNVGSHVIICVCLFLPEPFLLGLMILMKMKVRVGHVLSTFENEQYNTGKRIYDQCAYH